MTTMTTGTDRATDKQVVLIRILLRQRGLYEAETGRGLRDRIRQGSLSKADASRAIDILQVAS
ncbi:MAG: hypothetical protein ACLPYO_03855 [Mycobacterium sp.]